MLKICKPLPINQLLTTYSIYIINRPFLMSMIPLRPLLHVGASSWITASQLSFYLLFCLGDVRVRSRAGFESERRGSHPYIDFRIFHGKCWQIYYFSQTSSKLRVFIKWCNFPRGKKRIQEKTCSKCFLNDTLFLNNVHKCLEASRVGNYRNSFSSF